MYSRLWPVLILALGCGDEPTRDIFEVEGVVQGTVRTNAGAAVSDVWVALDGAYPLGNGNIEPLYDSVLTDGAGRYLGTLRALNLPDADAALTIRVWPPLNSALAPTEATGLELRMTSDLPPADTLEVDITLQPG